MPPSAPPATGLVLGGRYTLSDLIGEGGMSSVFRAEDRALGRSVAVKVMRATPGDATAAKRLRAEAAILAAVRHPSVVALYDADVDETGSGYLVMEYVAGPTLRRRLGEGPLPASDVATIALDLAGGLQAVHEAGIVHRDLTPSNVLLAPAHAADGSYRAKLADFGIAHLADTTRLTSPGMAVGTAAYLAPEQVRGQRPAPAADIYSLGLVLLEAVSGRRPFAGSTGPEMLAARLFTAPEIPADLPASWRSLLTAMTEVAPVDRPSAAEVVAAVRAAVSMASASRGADHATLPIVVPVTRTVARTAAAMTARPAAPLPRASSTPPRQPVSSRRSARRERRERRARRTALLAGTVGTLAAVALAFGLSVAPKDAVAVVEPTPTSIPTPAIEPGTSD